MGEIYESNVDDCDVEYANRRMSEMTREERREYRILSDEELFRFLRQEYWESLDSPRDIAIENAEIELLLRNEKGEKPN